jgi:hypothetical protein
VFWDHLHVSTKYKQNKDFPDQFIQKCHSYLVNTSRDWFYLPYKKMVDILNLITPPYNWNTARVCVKHKSINQWTLFIMTESHWNLYITKLLMSNHKFPVETGGWRYISDKNSLLRKHSDTYKQNKVLINRSE